MTYFDWMGIPLARRLLDLTSGTSVVVDSIDQYGNNAAWAADSSGIFIIDNRKLVLYDNAVRRANRRGTGCRPRRRSWRWPPGRRAAESRRLRRQRSEQGVEVLDRPAEIVTVLVRQPGQVADRHLATFDEATVGLRCEQHRIAPRHVDVERALVALRPARASLLPSPGAAPCRRCRTTSR